MELPPERLAERDQLRGPVQKFTEFFLESHWQWPRRHTKIADYVFLLTDPRVDEVSVIELGHLADDLQQHLFGAKGGGEVSLLVFEGPADAVITFSSFRQEEVAAALRDPTRLPPNGRLHRIRPGRRVEAVAAAPSPSAAEEAPELQVVTRRAATSEAEYRVGLLGTYFLARELFISDSITVAPAGSPHHYSAVEDERLLPPDEVAFTEACFKAVDTVLSAKAGGLPLNIPLSYSHFARPTQARRFRDLLDLLPVDRRPDLGASIYGVPRHLSAGLAQVNAILARNFSRISLITTDPHFEVEQFRPCGVRSVTLCLRDADPAARAAAMRAFAAKAELYRRRQMRQVLANLKTEAELELAFRLELHLVSGPAVCGFIEQPIGGRAVPWPRLPVRDLAA